MVERFRPESPRAKIAQTAESHAGFEFGPEELTKSDVARTLNIREADISQEEWRDISEFAVNAGAEIMQSAAGKEITDTPKSKDIRKIQQKILENRYGLVPFHDIFHAAEMYRLTGGKKASAAFAEGSERNRYIGPHKEGGELFPTLFLATASMPSPVPVLLTSNEGRGIVADFLTSFDLPQSSKDTIQNLLSAPTPPRAEDRQREFEMLIEEIVVGNAERKFTDLTPTEITELRKNFGYSVENPPDYYAQFAKRVFREEWRTNPRLFLDELLDCIRTTPTLSQ